eukprot:gene1121-1096_t
MSSNPAIATPAATVPWWKFGHVWLVIAGPLIVIVAGFVTLWLAISRPDPVVAEDYYRQGIEINKTLVAPEKSLAPALKARNHAATPMLVFAMVDPQDLHWFGQPLALSRQGVYTLTFFVFWAITMATSALTTLLSMSPFEVNRCPVPDGERPDDCRKTSSSCS